MPKPTIPRDDPAFLARFWAKVDKSAGPDGCWIWTGCRLPFGHGVVRINPKIKNWLAHRISWVLFFGDIPDGVGYHGTCVLHRCDNPPCVNPDHLFLGTAADNNADRDRKGRRARHFVRNPSSILRGERNPTSKLTDAQVIYARLSMESHAALGREFGVSAGAIAHIRKGRAWKHVR